MGWVGLWVGCGGLGEGGLGVIGVCVYVLFVFILDVLIICCCGIDWISLGRRVFFRVQTCGSGRRRADRGADVVVGFGFLCCFTGVWVLFVLWCFLGCWLGVVS